MSYLQRPSTTLTQLCPHPDPAAISRPAAADPALCLPQEPAGPDGGGEARPRAQDEEDGGRDGAGVRDEGQGEEEQAEGVGGGCK